MGEDYYIEDKIVDIENEIDQHKKDIEECKKERKRLKDALKTRPKLRILKQGV